MVVTLPLGCLKHEDVQFVPPVPARKVDAIRRLGFGLLNKVDFPGIHRTFLSIYHLLAPPG